MLDIDERNFMQEICDEMQSRWPKLDRLQWLECTRNEKIDVRMLPYRKTNYFSGLSGFFIGLKLRKLAR